MKKILILAPLVVLLLVMAGYLYLQQGPATISTSVFYSIDDETTITAKFLEDDTVEVHFMDNGEGSYAQAFTGYPETAASGARFRSENGAYVYWDQGVEALILKGAPGDDSNTLGEVIFAGYTADYDPDAVPTDTTVSLELRNTAWEYVATIQNETRTPYTPAEPVGFTLTSPGDETSAITLITGSGGCNNFFGEATVTDNSFTVGELGSTLIACEEALMDQERQFTDQLSQVTSYILSDTELQLTLTDGTIMVFTVLTEPVVPTAPAEAS